MLMFLVIALVMPNILPLTINDASKPFDHDAYACTGKSLSEIRLGFQPELNPRQGTPSGQENKLSTDDNEKWIKWGVYINGLLGLATLVIAIFAVIQLSLLGVR